MLRSIGVGDSWLRRARAFGAATVDDAGSALGPPRAEQTRESAHEKNLSRLSREKGTL
jgi:hypothetical protein